MKFRNGAARADSSDLSLYSEGIQMDVQTRRASRKKFCGCLYDAKSWVDRQDSQLQAKIHIAMRVMSDLESARQVERDHLLPGFGGFQNDRLVSAPARLGEQRV